MYFHKHKLFFQNLIIIIISASLFYSCGKENPVDKLIPFVPVDLMIDPHSPQFVPGPNGNGDLSIFGNWRYFNSGFRGIIIYNAGYENYKAYERTAPYGFPNDVNCKVVVDDTHLFAIDPCSNSKYKLLDGSPVEGPAILSLKQYKTHFDGIYLHVFN